MAMTPSNPEKGRAFRDEAQPVLERALGVSLTAEFPISVGVPPKQHKFDLVSENRSWVLECKNLAWRENGGVPQAKIASITEAATFLSLLGFACRRAVVLNRATHAKRRETLAEYFARLHSHSLGTAGLVEVDLRSKQVKWLVEPKAV